MAAQWLLSKQLLDSRFSFSGVVFSLDDGGLLDVAGPGRTWSVQVGPGLVLAYDCLFYFLIVPDQSRQGFYCGHKETPKQVRCQEYHMSIDAWHIFTASCLYVHHAHSNAQLLLVGRCFVFCERVAALRDCPVYIVQNGTLVGCRSPTLTSTLKAADGPSQ